MSHPPFSLSSNALTSIYQDTVSNSSLKWAALTATSIMLPVYMLYRSYDSNQNRAWLGKGPNPGIPSKETIQRPSTGKLATNGRGQLNANASSNRGSDLRVSKLLVHPIKSCRGTSVLQARYTPEGFENDRKWCIVDAETHAVLTARQLPQMVLIHPQIEPDDTNPHGGALKVTLPGDYGRESFSVPLNPTAETLQSWTSAGDVSLWGNSTIDGYVCDFLDSAAAKEKGLDSPSSILSRYLGRPALLLCKGPRTRRCQPTDAFPDLDASLYYQDGYPLLIMTDESMAQIESVIQSHLNLPGLDDRWKHGKMEIERFRPNIVIQGAGPFAEDAWEEITISNESCNEEDRPEFRLVSKCTRCLLPNVNIHDGIPDKVVPYKVLTKFRAGLDPTNKYKPCVGCNAVPSRSGVLKVGDVVHVVKAMSM